jgi:5-formyltetrahydrofolate cyclo-ligase
MKVLKNEKTTLRVKISKRLAQFSEIDKQKADAVIFKKVLSRPEIIQSKSICVYVSTHNEVDTKKIIEHLLVIGRNVVVPRIADDRLLLYIIKSLDDLQAGIFGIDEPKEGTSRVDTSSVDLFIVPGLAFDRNGHRLGRGGGYFDKLLTGVTVPKIGLAYVKQIVAEVPYTSYDISMTALITEEDS